MRSATSHWKNATVAACACALLLGCASIGPSTITRDRFDYVTAISESLKRQVLLSPGSPKFRELMSALRQAQIAEGTGFRIRSDKDAPVVVMFARPANAEGAAATRRVRELLGLDMSRGEFSVVYGSAAQNDTEIAVLTRSILQVMQDLASHVDVPAADIAQGRVYGVQRSADEEEMFPALLAVRHGDGAPDDAFTSVRYRNQWFWIDDNDQVSKHTLGFLLLMFALSEGATPVPPPVVTVPVR